MKDKTFNRMFTFDRQGRRTNEFKSGRTEPTGKQTIYFSNNLQKIFFAFQADAIPNNAKRQLKKAAFATRMVLMFSLQSYTIACLRTFGTI